MYIWAWKLLTTPDGKALPLKYIAISVSPVGRGVHKWMYFDFGVIIFPSLRVLTDSAH